MSQELLQQLPSVDRLLNTARLQGLQERLSHGLVVGAAREGLLPLWASLRPRGGKLDDCTVVAAFLVDAEE